VDFVLPSSADQFRPGHLQIAIRKRRQTPEFLETVPLFRDDKDNSKSEQDDEPDQEQRSALIPKQPRQEKHLKSDEEEISIPSTFPQFSQKPCHI
jgi:hypothetical protein